MLAAEAKNSSAAFAELYRRYQHKIYGYLLVRVGNVQDAQDLTAQTFLAALESIASYQGRGTFAAWLFGISRRKVAAYFQRRQETLPLEMVNHLPDPGLAVEEVIGQQMELEQVIKMVSALSPDRAEALSLRIFARLSTAEVAEVMGKSEAAVRMLLYRAVGNLRQWLAHHRRQSDESK
ncbi:MAG: sigma-70 family RNA polymerase sigma factor [Chloroflexota bacterium]|nr:sigma-70 family RNA polymerase sigma factor [Chloroflexota bacterium]